MTINIAEMSHALGRLEDRVDEIEKRLTAEPPRAMIETDEVVRRLEAIYQDTFAMRELAEYIHELKAMKMK